MHCSCFFEGEVRVWGVCVCDDPLPVTSLSSTHTHTQEFVEMEDWAHLDIAGVMDASGDVPFLGKGMSGMCILTVILIVETLMTVDSP